MAPSKPTVSEPIPLPEKLPQLPVAPEQFIKHVNGNPHISVRELLKPFREYESVLRAYFAQAPDHEFVKDNCVNLIDVFADANDVLYIQRRNLQGESSEERNRYDSGVSLVCGVKNC